MGQKSSKSQGLLSGKSKRVGGDDGLIGNRKVRTIVISLVLIAFCALSFAYLQDYRDKWNELNVDTVFGETCESCESAANALAVVMAGAATIGAACIFAMLLFFINCDDNVGRVAGVLLIIGGLLYLVGWLWYINVYVNMIPDIIYDNMGDEDKERLNAMLAGWFGEALLPSMTAILLGFDVFMHLFDDEAKRLATNLLNLVVVSAMAGPVYYLLSDKSDSTTWDNAVLYLIMPIDSDAYNYIATGYLVIFCFAFAYVVLYICTCCTCDCKDTRFIRLIMALGLIAGGVLSAIGYYIYAGEFTSSNSDDPTNKTLYYIGYTVMIAGACIIWALDMGIDDIKG